MDSAGWARITLNNYCASLIWVSKRKYRASYGLADKKHGKYYAKLNQGEFNTHFLSDCFIQKFILALGS